MAMKIQKAVDQLNKILPLSKRQKNLSSDIASIYQKILYNYVDTGRALSTSEMAN